MPKHEALLQIPTSYHGTYEKLIAWDGNFPTGGDKIELGFDNGEILTFYVEEVVTTINTGRPSRITTRVVSNDRNGEKSGRRLQLDKMLEKEGWNFLRSTESA